MGKDLNGKDLGKGITQRKDGLYMARAVVNKKKIPTIYGSNLKELRKKLESAKKEALLDSVSNIVSECPTLNEWFEVWFEIYKKPVLRGSNPNAYTRSTRNYFLPRIGDKKLNEIRPMHIQICIPELIEEGKGVKSIRDGVRVLRYCLDGAVGNGYILTNPALSINVPGEDNPRRRVLSLDEQEIFIDFVKANKRWFEELYLILLTTGLRISEAAGLKWSDIDFQSKFIHVNKQLVTYYEDGHKTMKFCPPKTQNSCRCIPFFEETKSILIAQKSKVEEQRRIKKKVWRASPEFDDLVFYTSLGSPISRYSVSTDLDSIVKQINLMAFEESKRTGSLPYYIKHINPHAFRHTFATRAFEKGMSPRIVQEIMGHANYGITISYTHVIETAKTVEAQKVGSFLDNQTCVEDNNVYEEVLKII